MIRAALIVGCLTLLVLGCQRQVEGAPEPGGLVDTLPLSLAAVKRISGFDGLQRGLDIDNPKPGYSGPDGPCQALFDQVAFGDDWTEFRVVADGGDLDVGGQLPLLVAVDQTLAVYPDHDAARAVFDDRVTAMTDCAELRIEYLDGTVSRPDADTVIYTTDQWTLVSVVKSTVLVDVSVATLPEAERIATDISRAIVDRIS